MGLYEDNNYCGISILKWDSILEDYVFDHDPTSVVYFNQEQKFIKINKDSRFICICDRDDIGFNDQLTIYVLSINNMLKTGARNLIRMFHPGWLATKQSCILLLRCQVKLVTTSCSVVTMIDDNSVQCAHKNKFTGRDNNFIVSLTENRFELRNNNTIKCREKNVINLKDNNKIITTNNANIICGNNNILICQDNCIITVDSNCTIIAGDNSIINCLGNSNFISCGNNCTINSKECDTIFAGDLCVVRSGINTGISVGLNCVVNIQDSIVLIKFSLTKIIITETGYELVDIGYGNFNRESYIDFFTTYVIGVKNSRGEMVATWEYGTENPEPNTPFTWLRPKGYPDHCLGYESWFTDEIFEENYDSCCPGTGGMGGVGVISDSHLFVPICG